MGRGRSARQFRPPVPLWAIACEDSASAPRYFTALQRLYHGRVLLKVAPNRGHDTGPRQVVERAAGFRDDLATAPDDPIPAWAIIDREPQAEPSREQQIHEAIEWGRSEGVEVIVCNPCFEHWLHLHLKDVDGGHGSCREAERALAGALAAARVTPNYHKGRTDLSSIVTAKSVAQAAAWAERRHAMQGGAATPIHRCRPCVTDCSRLIRALDALGPHGP